VKLAEYMMMRGVTQSELARTMNVTRASVNNWIYHRTPPSGQKMMELYKWSGGKVGLKDWCGEFDV
jgi:DNA-binding transcriptional regulator YiaG